jgi:hypothetical protein
MKSDQAALNQESIVYNRSEAKCSVIGGREGVLRPAEWDSDSAMAASESGANDVLPASMALPPPPPSTLFTTPGASLRSPLPEISAGKNTGSSRLSALPSLNSLATQSMSNAPVTYRVIIKYNIYNC